MKAKDKEALSFERMVMSQAIVQVQYNTGVFLPAVIRDFWIHLTGLLSKDLKVRDTENQDQYRARYGKGVEINIGSSAFGMTDFLPKKDLQNFITVANAIYMAALEVLKIEEIRRVGFRVYYTQEFPDGDVLADALLRTPHLSIPDGLSLHGSESVLPMYQSGYTDGAKVIVYKRLLNVVLFLAY